jgi:hypothetical protein
MNHAAAHMMTLWSRMDGRTKALLGLGFILVMAEQKCRGDWK